MPIMAMTTSSSTSVNPRCFGGRDMFMHTNPGQVRSRRLDFGTSISTLAPTQRVRLAQAFSRFVAEPIMAS